jgi:hypothetical protein
MKYLWMGFCVLLSLGLNGCTEADKAQWQDALKDARGDNMQMRSGDFSKAQAFTNDPSVEPKPRDLPSVSE